MVVRAVVALVRSNVQLGWMERTGRRRSAQRSVGECDRGGSVVSVSRPGGQDAVTQQGHDSSVVNPSVA